jgi:hypothetical protein
MNKRLVYFKLSIGSIIESISISSLEAILLDGELIGISIDDNEEAIHGGAVVISKGFKEPLWRLTTDETEIADKTGAPIGIIYDDSTGIIEGSLEEVISLMLDSAEIDPSGYDRGEEAEPNNSEDYFWRIFFEKGDVEEALVDQGFGSRQENLTTVKKALDQHMGSEKDMATLHMLIDGLAGQEALIRIGSQRLYTAV